MSGPRTGALVGPPGLVLDARVTRGAFTLDADVRVAPGEVVAVLGDRQPCIRA